MISGRKRLNLKSYLIKSILMLVNLGAIMKKHTKENILKQYEKSGEIMYHTTLNGDYRKCNREGEKLQKIFKEFEKIPL